MSLADLADRIGDSDGARTLQDWIRRVEKGGGESSRLRVKGAAGSLPSFLLARATRSSSGPLVALTADPETATYLHSDLAEILEPSDLEAELFPPTGHHPYDRDQIAQAEPVMQRADVLQALREGFDGLDYYPPNPEYRVEATLEVHDDPEPVVMETTADTEVRYERVATLHFELDGEERTLTIDANYVNEQLSELAKDEDLSRFIL